MHDSTHAPPVHTSFIPHAPPQWPQFFGSLAVLVHVVPQSVLGGAQETGSLWPS
jgi:hypothetical protein